MGNFLFLDAANGGGIVPLDPARFAIFWPIAQLVICLR
jgi:hypothetical protein